MRFHAFAFLACHSDGPVLSRSNRPECTRFNDRVPRCIRFRWPKPSRIPWQVSRSQTQVTRRKDATVFLLHGPQPCRIRFTSREETLQAVDKEQDDPNRERERKVTKHLCICPSLLSCGAWITKITKNWSHRQEGSSEKQRPDARPARQKKRTRGNST